MNNTIKDILVKTVFRVASIVNILIPKKDNIVLFYSNVGFRDNIRSVYDYMIKENYNSKYRIYISANSFLPDIVPENVTVINNIKGVMKFFTSGHVFYSQGKIPIYPSKRQNVVQMWHGTPFKGNDNRQNKSVTSKSYYTHIFCSSPYFEQIMMDNFYVGRENVSICGQPRTDVMYEEYEMPRELEKFSKIIIWLPTWRKSSVVGQEDVKQKTVVPIFSINKFDELENELSKYNICLIIKLHYMQDPDLLENVNYEHILLMNDIDFQNKKWELYRLLGKSDALITDYSSVFYDYMLLDRPIGYAIDDYEEFRNHRGFVVEDPEYFMAGEKIKTKEDFYDFISHVSDNIDIYKKQREDVNRITHTYRDGENCKRALNIGGINL